MSFDCQTCDDTGWHWEMIMGEPEQVHCIWCAANNKETTMTTPYCQDDMTAICTDLDARVTAKGFQHPDTSIRFPGFGECPGYVAIEGRVGGDYATRWSKLFAFVADENGQIDMDTAIAAAKAHIDDLQSPDEARRSAFQKSLAALIDTANEIGLDLALVNPLTRAMQALSENIIEHHPIAAE